MANTNARDMKRFKKTDFPVSDVRRFLEPGPIVLVSSAWKGKTNIMTMGWHMIMEFEPSLVGCYVWSENHSFDMIRNSKECVSDQCAHGGHRREGGRDRQQLRPATSTSSRNSGSPPCRATRSRRR